MREWGKNTFSRLVLELALVLPDLSRGFSSLTDLLWLREMMEPLQHTRLQLILEVVLLEDALLEQKSQHQQLCESGGFGEAA